MKKLLIILSIITSICFTGPFVMAELEIDNTDPDDIDPISKAEISNLLNGDYGSFQIEYFNIEGIITTYAWFLYDGEWYFIGSLTDFRNLGLDCDPDSEESIGDLFQYRVDTIDCRFENDESGENGEEDIPDIGHNNSDE